MAILQTSAYISNVPDIMSNVVQARTAEFLAFQGATFNINFPVYNYDGTAFNLTGYSVTGWMNQSYSNTGVDTPLQLIVSVTGSPTLGIINWQISSTNSAALTPDRYYFNIDISQGSNDFRVLRGIITVAAGVEPLLTITTTQTISGMADISS